GEGEAEHEPAVHPQGAGGALRGQVEGDVLDGLGEAPDRATRLAGELLVDGQVGDVGAGLVGPAARGRDEERDADLPVVAEVVVAVVDDREDELAAAGRRLDRNEGLGHHAPGGGPGGLDGGRPRGGGAPGTQRGGRTPSGRAGGSTR